MWWTTRPDLCISESVTAHRGRVEEALHRKDSRWYKLLHPPLPVYHNPRERGIESRYPMGKWNLLIGGAGQSVPGYVNIDLFAPPGVDIICTAECLPFREGQFGRVECAAVLEHVEKPELVIEEIHRCLARGGVGHLVVPFCHPFHEYPKDFRRYTPDGLHQLCNGFEILEGGWRSGPTATWIVFTLEYAKTWAKNKWAKRAIHFALGWLLFPLRYLDSILFEKEAAGQIGNHYYLCIRKP